MGVIVRDQISTKKEIRAIINDAGRVASAAPFSFLNKASAQRAWAVARRGLVLECRTTHNRLGCDLEGGCCACRVLEVERDF